MPRYFFHIDDGTAAPDAQGLELPDIKAARAEAVRASGEILSDFDGHFWDASTPWTMHVTDSDGQLQFSLQFSAKVPAGPVTYEPLAGPAET